jgi:hypothetical protein
MNASTQYCYQLKRQKQVVIPNSDPYTHNLLQKIALIHEVGIFWNEGRAESPAE